MISNQSFLLQSLGWAGLNSFWQMALLWIVFQFIINFFKLKSSTKSSIATTLLIAGFVWFAYTFIFINNNKADITLFSTGIFNVQGDLQVNNWFLQILPVATIAYLFFLIFPILRFIRNYRYVQIIRRYGLTKVDIVSKTYISKTALHLGIKRKVNIWVSDLVSSPVTIGFLKPIILVPLAAINNLSTQQLEAVLLHELAHIKRSDYLINLIINVIRTILYFNPFVIAFIKIIETEREKSCDEIVLQFQYNSHDYASALLELEKTNRTTHILTLAASGSKHELLNRIENILNIQKEKKVTVRKISQLFFSICLIVLINIGFAFKKQLSISTLNSNYAVFGVTKFWVDEKKLATVKNDSKIISPMIENSVKENDSQIKPAITFKEKIAENFVNTTFLPELINVALKIEQLPELNQYQEEQIRSALESSKKVLENKQWKNVEENIADVFTLKEKNELKESFQQEIEKFDWSMWENRLRIAYNNINWDKVNSQLNNTIKEIRIDSLQKSYVNIAEKLNEVKNELTNKKLTGIPDSDITLEHIIEKKDLVQRILNELKTVKTKKIVHL